MNYRDQLNALLDQQDAKGMNKYGRPLEQNPAGIYERLQHMAEEKVDDLRYTFWVMDLLKTMWWRFPRVKFVDMDTLSKQLDHIRSEHREMWLAHENGKIGDLAMELFDLIHSCETALRILQEFYGIDIWATMQAVIEKNQKRGYYDASSID